MSALNSLEASVSKDDLILANAKLQIRVEELEQEVARLNSIITEHESNASTTLSKQTNPLTFQSAGINEPPFKQLVHKEIVTTSIVPPSNLNPFGIAKGVHKGNILCASFVSLTADDENSIVISGGADKCLKMTIIGEDGIINVPLQESLVGLTFDAPIVTLKVHPDYAKGLVAVGTLDGQVQLVKINTDLSSEKDCFERLGEPMIAHSKHVTSLAWSICGRWLASASRDQSVIVYTLNRDEVGDGIRLQHKQSLNCNDCPESIAFTNAFSMVCLAMAVRNSSDLYYLSVGELPPNVETYDTIKLAEGTMEKVPLFEKDGFVSFTILNLEAAPAWKPFLVCSNDRNCHFILASGSTLQCLELYGHSSGQYGFPKVSWHPSGKYIVSNSEIEQDLFVWAVETGQLLCRLSGHGASVRSVMFHPTKGTLVSCGFDHNILVWNQFSYTI